MWVFHRQLSEDDAKRERVSSVDVARRQRKIRARRPTSFRCRKGKPEGK